MRLAVRIAGMLTLLASPLLAVWAAFVFRKSRIPELRGWYNNLKEILRASATMVLEGKTW